MDIRNFFSKASSSLKSNESRIKEVVKTPENKKCSKTEKVIMVPKKETRLKPVAKPEISESDDEDPIPSKFLKALSKDRSQSRSPQKAPAKAKTNKTKRRVQIESDGSDESEMAPQKFTKLQDAVPELRRSPRGKDKKTKDAAVKCPIPPVVDLDKESDGEKAGVVRGARKLPKPKDVKHVKVKQSLHIEKADVPEKEEKSKRKSDSTEQATASKKAKISSKNLAENTSKDKHLNPISVVDFFNGTKLKPPPSSSTALHKQEQEIHSDEDFNQTLIRAQEDLVSPAQKKKTSPNKKRSKHNADDAASHATVTKTTVKNGASNFIQSQSPSSDLKPRQKLADSKTASRVSTHSVLKPVTPEDRRECQRTPGSSPSKVDVCTDGKATVARRTPRKEKALPTSKPSSSTQQLMKPTPNTARTVIADQADETSSCLLVDRYKPTSLRQIIGQQGDKSCVNKLLNWLRNWNAWHVTKTAEKKKGFGANDDGSCYKCALLSGAPGIGKTTSAELCCQELGIRYIARNASDTRNKKTLESQLMESITSHNMSEFCDQDEAKLKNYNIAQHALIMDEVDGMSGNEDRAGISELIAFIKKTKIPLICICNDRQAQKIRSLANYCFDLRFHRPQVSQIKGPMMSIAYKENLKLSGPELEQLIEASGHDIRQLLYKLSLLSTHSNDTNVDVLNKKDTATNIFETIRTIFSDDSKIESGHKKTWNEKCELFFSDYNLTPLFTFENYLNVEAKNAKKVCEKLDLISEAAEYMSLGDLTEKLIRTKNNWSLLTSQAIFSVVAPAEKMKGYLKGMAQFPQWFGKNSKQNKNARIMSQLQMHTSLKTSCSACSFNLDYAPALRFKIFNCLLDDGIGSEAVLRILQQYDLTKEDMDNIVDLTQYPNSKESMSKIPAKVKAALTRSYNKANFSRPFSMAADLITTGKKSKKGIASKSKAIDSEEEADADEDDADEINAQIFDYDD